MKSESAVLVLSDLHAGKRTESFNLDVLNKRLSAIFQNTSKLLNIIGKAYNIEELRVFFLGDFVDGDSIYPSQQSHLDERANYPLEQAGVLADMLVPGLIDVQSQLDVPVIVDAVRGNHGRAGRFTHESNNWDVAVYDYIQRELRHNGDFEVYVSDKFAHITEIQGHGALLYHGAGIRSYAQLPLYGITQRILKWKQGMDNGFSIATFGHFHSFLDYHYFGTDIFLTGTAVSDDDFSLEYIGCDGVNKAWLFGVHPEHGVTWRFPVLMEEDND